MTWRIGDRTLDETNTKLLERVVEMSTKFNQAREDLLGARALVKKLKVAVVVSFMALIGKFFK